MLERLKQSPISWLHLPLVFVFPVVLWFFHSHNSMLASADGAHYLQLAMGYTKLFQTGFWEGLTGLFEYRSIGMRPMIYPHFVTFFMWLAGGDLYDTAKYTHVFFASVWCLYTYLLVRLFAGRLKAVCAAFLIVGWPGFFASHVSLFSEAAFLTFLFATYYHVFASHYLEKRGHAVAGAVFAALTLCTRPELLFIIAPGLAYYFFRTAQRENNVLRELLLSVCAVVLMVALLAVSHFACVASGPPLAVAATYKALSVALAHSKWVMTPISLLWETPYSLLSLTIAAATSLAIGLLLRGNRGALKIFHFVALMCGLTLAWYLPFADQLYEWFMVGLYNKQDFNNPVAGFATNWRLIYPSWQALFIMLFVLAVFAFVTERVAQRVSFSVMVERYGQVLIVGLVLCVIYFTLLLMKSAGITPLRRTDPGSFTLMAGLLIFTACATKPWARRVVNVSLCVATIAMFAYSLSAFNPIWHNDSLKEYARFMLKKVHVAWQPVVIADYPRSDYALVEALTKLVEKRGLQGAYIRSPSLDNWPPDLTLGINLAQEDIEPPFRIELWTILSEEWKSLKFLKQMGTTHLLVDDFPEWSDEKLKNRIGYHFYPAPELIYRIRQGDLQGMKKVDTLEVNGRHYTLYKL